MARRDNGCFAVVTSGQHILYFQPMRTGDPADFGCRVEFQSFVDGAQRLLSADGFHLCVAGRRMLIWNLEFLPWKDLFSPGGDHWLAAELVKSGLRPMGGTGISSLEDGFGEELSMLSAPVAGTGRAGVDLLDSTLSSPTAPDGRPRRRRANSCPIENWNRAPLGAHLPNKSSNRSPSSKDLVARESSASSEQHEEVLVACTANDTLVYSIDTRHFSVVCSVLHRLPAWLFDPATRGERLLSDARVRRLQEASLRAHSDGTTLVEEVDPDSLSSSSFAGGRTDDDDETFVAREGTGSERMRAFETHGGAAAGLFDDSFEENRDRTGSVFGSVNTSRRNSNITSGAASVDSGGGAPVVPSLFGKMRFASVRGGGLACVVAAGDRLRWVSGGQTRTTTGPLSAALLLGGLSNPAPASNRQLVLSCNWNDVVVHVYRAATKSGGLGTAPRSGVAAAAKVARDVVHIRRWNSLQDAGGDEVPALELPLAAQERGTAIYGGHSRCLLVGTAKGGIFWWDGATQRLFKKIANTQHSVPIYRIQPIQNRPDWLVAFDISGLGQVVEVVGDRAPRVVLRIGLQQTFFPFAAITAGRNCRRCGRQVRTRRPVLGKGLNVPRPFSLSGVGESFFALANARLPTMLPNGKALHADEQSAYSYPCVYVIAHCGRLYGIISSPVPGGRETRVWDAKTGRPLGRLSADEPVAALLLGPPLPLAADERDQLCCRGTVLQQPRIPARSPSLSPTSLRAQSFQPPIRQAASAATAQEGPLSTIAEGYVSSQTRLGVRGLDSSVGVLLSEHPRLTAFAYGAVSVNLVLHSHGKLDQKTATKTSDWRQKHVLRALQRSQRRPHEMLNKLIKNKVLGELLKPLDESDERLSDFEQLFARNYFDVFHHEQEGGFVSSREAAGGAGGTSSTDGPLSRGRRRSAWGVALAGCTRTMEGARGEMERRLQKKRLLLHFYASLVVFSPDEDLRFFGRNLLLATLNETALLAKVGRLSKDAYSASSFWPPLYFSIRPRFISSPTLIPPQFTMPTSRVSSPFSLRSRAPFSLKTHTRWEAP